METDDFSVGDYIKLNQYGREILTHSPIFKHIMIHEPHKIYKIEYKRGLPGRGILLFIEGYDDGFHYTYADLYDHSKSMINSLIDLLDILEDNLRNGS